MVKIFSARTLPVNPPDAEFVLDRATLWKALQRKIRNATEFVPAMRQCTVVSDKDGLVLRDCVLEKPDGSLREMREEVTSHGEQWVSRSGHITPAHLADLKFAGRSDHLPTDGRLHHHKPRVAWTK